MELLQIENLSFTYPQSTVSALDGLSLSVRKGEFVLLMGESGCGKTTLLRLIKRELAPFGEKRGEIVYNGVSLPELEARASAGEIGFVGQNPDEQIVTDKVWHELAFGAENLGVEPEEIGRRVAETASYFGIQEWYGKDTDALSGGQKQLLNLAAVMVTHPRLLLLDEPTGQLDPISAASFLTMLQKLNRELGVTVVLAEHRLEEIFPAADRVAVMENGKMLCADSPRAVCAALRGHRLFAGLPCAARIWNGLKAGGECPLTVREGRAFLEQSYAARRGGRVTAAPAPAQRSAVIEARGLWFRYEKKQPDILRDAGLSVTEGEIFGILGGNGTGKTTLLQVLSGLEHPYRGTVRIFGKKLSDYKDNSLYRGCLALLPQSPKTVFVASSVGEELAEVISELPAPERDRRIEQIAQAYGLLSLLERHPYDLSGGEQQKCALAKLLLGEPRLLLLDEPTKGLDAFSKQRLLELLTRLRGEGRTILLVTHDVEFAAAVCDRCALFFNGALSSPQPPNVFFSSNHFYTTAASRISRDFFENAVRCEEVVALCGKTNV